MKNLFKRTSFLCLLVVFALALVACGTDNPTPKPNPKPSDVDPAYVSLDDYKAYIKEDLKDVVSSIDDQVEGTVKTSVESELTKGLKAIDESHSIGDVRKAYAAAKQAVANCVTLAQNVQSYSGVSMSDKTEILGKLEAYAVRNGITGISLFENGGYVMYNPRVTLGTENYIVGYGFGTLAEGSINSDLANESVAAWKRYYHTVNASDPGSLNYLNDQGSEISDFYGYIGSAFYTNFMNEHKDGYDWVPELAKEKPQPVDGTVESAKIWRFEVRTGKDGLKYNTNSAIASRKAFDGRLVEAEDYLTPFRLLLTKSNNLYRGGELANNSTGAIKGAKAYYAATSNKDYTSDEAKKLFDETVGLKVYEEEGKVYFQVEYTQALSQFYAMYYIASNLYAPIPQEFLNLVTVENYLGYNANKTETPVDNSLSLGSYTLERWDSNQQVVYKKNPYYVYADTKYAIEGVHIHILTALATDNEAGFKEFLAGNTDSTGIPQTKLQEYKSDPRTRQTKGDSNFKLNVNATSKETWEKLFGENGTATITPKDDYWDVKPALSNSHFVKALSLSINRLEFASARGSVPAISYLSSNYMSDPENGISYSATKAHENAIATLLKGTDPYGYSVELAREYFKVALSELEADGAYTAGTKENPTVISLEIAWQYPQHENAYHKEIKQYLETAFNDESVSGGKYKLEINFWVGDKWSDVYYNKMMVGQYDIAFGSISGNALNPLEFMNVLSADQTISNNFTLNWGTDTNDPDADILVYDGKRWSYDALYKAATSFSITNDGTYSPAYGYSLVSEEQADGSFVLTATLSETLPALTDITVTKVALCWYEVYNQTGDGKDYKETEFKSGEYTVKEENGKVVITVTVPKSLVTEYYGEVGLDVTFDINVDGNEITGELVSLYTQFPGQGA